MRKILILGLGLLASLLFILPARYVYVCKIMNNCAPDTAAAPAANLALMNGDSAILKGYEHFSFGLGSISPELTPNNEAFLDKIAAYLKENPDKHLTITGLYRKSEEGKRFGMYENLGIARANIMRDLLVGKGVDIRKITLDYEALTDDNLNEPVRFNVYVPVPENYEDGSLVKTKFSFDDMTFSDANFEFNSDVFKPGSAFQFWADSVQTYFKLNPNKTLSIIGHTDNIGTTQYNQDLGLRRAQAAKVYFSEKGLSGSINTSTKGERAPVAPNTTPVGRQKNRRVNFVIK